MSDSNDPDPIPTSGPEGESELHAALGEGDPQRVRALVEAGADIRYEREHGYDALVDAVHGRDVESDPRLLELLTLLVGLGVDLSGVTSYGESGLRVLSRLGRFDAVRLLLDAGADKSQLEWSPLMEAVALGSLADVRAALARGAALEDRDWWSRTPWLIALQTGDIAKAKLLRESGADPTACGRCGRPPLFYAIQGPHLDVLRWLLAEGASVHQTDEFGTTALIEAVGQDDLECVDLLLDAGADVGVNANGTALRGTGSREIIRRLLDAGADPADADQRVILGLQATGDEALAAVSPDDFRRAFTRSFGRRNPDRMDFPFWQAMIRSGASAYEGGRRFEKGRTLREPVWCAQRYGQSLTGVLHFPEDNVARTWEKDTVATRRASGSDGCWVTWPCGMALSVVEVDSSLSLLAEARRAAANSRRLFPSLPSRDVALRSRLSSGTTRSQLAVARYSNSQVSFSSRFSGSLSSHSLHEASRKHANMSANVGLTLFLYHGRCLCACSSSIPVRAYHSTTSVPVNHAIGCALCTDFSVRTIGSWNPSLCLASQ